MSGLERLFFVVWTGKGDPFVELVHFEAEFWQQVLPNLVIFFKTYLQRVILGFRPLCCCPLCDSLCLEPEEFDNCNENSLQCESPVVSLGLLTRNLVLSHLFVVLVITLP